ncbi:MAG: hypothetical protein AAGG07_11965 [Planctomycetota bacterium]
MARGAKRKASTSKKKPQRGHRAGPTLSPEQVKRITVALGIAGVGAGLAYGLFVGVDALEARAAMHVEREVSADGPELRIVWPVLRTDDGREATWLHHEFQRRIEQAAKAAAANQPGPFNPRQLAAVGTAMIESGWFSEPPAVRRAPGGAIEVVGRWRVPVAVVRFRGSDYLVARDGGRLPEQYPENGSGLPVVLGVREPPPVRVNGENASVPDYATAWRGETVAQAITLLTTLGPEPFFEQIAGVDVSDSRSAGGLTIITGGQGRVVWGSEPGVFRPGEVNTETKVERLRRLHARTGRIDAGRSVIEIHRDQPLEIDPPRDG